MTHAPALNRAQYGCDGRGPAALLAEAGTRVDPLLRAAVRAMAPATALVCGYHLGWGGPGAAPGAANPGAAVRPALVLAAARAAGGRAEDALPAAAAVELTHHFTLLHDEVADRAAARRDRPAASSVFGAADAMLAGGALQAAALELLADHPHRARGRAVAVLAGCIIEICEDRHAGGGPGPRADGAPDQCLRTAEAETGALLGACCALGALYAGAPEPAAAAMDRFGRRIALAFQLVDDLAGIWGDPAVTGQPAGADLAARRRSLPVVAALDSGTPAGARLAELYALDRPLNDAELRRAADAVQDCGARAWAQNEAAELMADAVAQLASAVPDPDAADDLLTLAELATRRAR